MPILNRDIPQIRLVSVDEISAELLDEYVNGYLMNRDRLGIPLRQQLVNHLCAMTEGETLVIDCRGIEEMTTSVAEEIGPRLFEEFLAHRDQGKDVYLVYCNVSSEIASGFEGAFRIWQPRLDPPRRMTIVVFGSCQDNQFTQHQFLGEVVPDALRDTLDLIYRLGQTNSSELKTHGIKAASRKLNELSSQYPWLLRKVQRSLDAGPRAWAYFYSPIVPVLGSQE
jgi:hypothetical protein